MPPVLLHAARAALPPTRPPAHPRPPASCAAQSILGLTEGEASRLREDVEEKKAAAAAAVAAVEAEKREREQLQDAVKKASEYKPRIGKNQGAAPKDAPVADDEDDEEEEEEEEAQDRGEGTHEYECTKCGYIMFPAAGREFKFYGDDFKCPTCGADKGSFVDNGVVEV